MSRAQARDAQPLRAAGDSHVGKVRTTNEDALIVEPRLGLYAVLDGMGGANAGDVASGIARDTVREIVAARRGQLPPRGLLEAALNAGSGAVFSAAQRNRERHGMGTTAVACLIVDPGHAVVAHVGDSRAYLLRAGRLQALTRDHTIVEELVERGVLSADDAEHHPYKNVLSRNLGARAETRVDVVELELRPGDRLLLCSDGLYGYATAEAIQYLLGSGDAPVDVARDLIELALRGGGGDNVSVIVIEAPSAPASTTELVRTAGAQAWWQRRPRFLAAAEAGRLVDNPIVRGLPAHEALELVALSLCQAIYHDLEKSTGVNVWTFAQNLAAGWFERGGDWPAVRGLVDVLTGAARAVVDDVRAADAALGFLLDVAVSRALIVAELALGGLLAERLRQLDGEVIALHSEAQDTVEVDARDAAARPGDGPAPRSSEGFLDRPTLPFLRPDRPVTSSGISAGVLAGIGQAITLARARAPARGELIGQVLGALEQVATDTGGNFAAAVHAARELYGVRGVDEAGVMPLFDALEHARVLAIAGAQSVRAAPGVRLRVLRALATAHQRLVGATTGLVVEAVAPAGERLREAKAVTGELRDAVAKAERRRADLERRFATIVDENLPWGSRGTTEW